MKKEEFRIVFAGEPCKSCGTENFMGENTGWFVELRVNYTGSYKQPDPA